MSEKPDCQNTKCRAWNKEYEHNCEIDGWAFEISKCNEYRVAAPGCPARPACAEASADRPVEGVEINKLDILAGAIMYWWDKNEGKIEKPKFIDAAKSILSRPAPAGELAQEAREHEADLYEQREQQLAKIKKEMAPAQVNIDEPHELLGLTHDEVAALRKQAPTQEAVVEAAIKKYSKEYIAELREKLLPQQSYREDAGYYMSGFGDGIKEVIEYLKAALRQTEGK